MSRSPRHLPLTVRARACDPGTPPPAASPPVKSKTSIPVVDIFAGAGGLGEGFEAYGDGSRFHVALSAEMDRHAVRTLHTRAFFRSFPKDEAPRSYYQYLRGEREAPWTKDTQTIWEEAGKRARQFELGNVEDDKLLDDYIAEIAADARKRDLPWVLVGGPPCQAFSLVGRARNRGIAHYVPEEDGRHFLYEHYLHILAKHEPAAFVLENVKGMLSSQVGGAHMFKKIFDQLQEPNGPSGPRYRIEPLVEPAKPGWNPKNFIVRGERLGLPQTRHRVILVGVRNEIDSVPPLYDDWAEISLAQMMRGVPAVRSSSTTDDIGSWQKFAAKCLSECAGYAREIDAATARYLKELAPEVRDGLELGTGGQWMEWFEAPRYPKHLHTLMRDSKAEGMVHHETRPHMTQDLLRYAYASAFAELHERSPRGADEFPIALHPEHKSWKEAKGFVDRFKVQRSNAPSSTITSHLAKDGHYFIHPDPAQMRSLTVREAARLQTFPDNFFFEGPIGAKRKQVGNAVPPWLGHQVASVLDAVLR